MDETKFTELELLIGRLDTRLTRLERQLGIKDRELQQQPKEKIPVTPIPDKAFAPPPEEVSGPRVSSNLLGIVGIACLILAMILLIKFSIDSGWLTPLRQLLLATLFGASLIGAPIVFHKMSDKQYLSLLPAGGVVILHLTVYGGIFFHQLLNPILGILAVWGIGFLSIWLLNKFRHDLYGILAISGTYLGSTLVKLSFPSLIPIAINILAWDIIFSLLAIRLKNRLFICITAYFALGVVALYHGIDSATLHNGPIALIQFAQILIFSLGTASYSIQNKVMMTEKESWQLFPVFLFFYGLEFALLDAINPLFATIFSIVFSFLLLGVYFFTRGRTGENKFQSTHAVFTLVALMLIHSIYVVNLSDTGKMIFGLIPLALLGLYGKRLKEERLIGLLGLGLLVLSFSTFLVLANPSNLAPAGIICLGIVYGGSVLYGYKTSKEFPILFVSHGLIVLSICRLGDVIGEIWIAPILVAYAYAALVWGLRWQDKNLGKSAFPVIFFAIGHFLFFNFDGLSQGQRIVTLIVMGVIIYAGGYVYRKIPEPTSSMG